MADGTVTVRSSDMREPPLLVSSKANVIEFRGENGTLLCFWKRLFKEGNPKTLWAFCANTDPDWNETCSQFGVH